MDSDGSNARSVRIAVEYRDLEALRVAIAQGRNIEEANEIGDTPFLTACASGQFVIAETLLDAGANVFAFDQFGNTAGRSIELVAFPAGSLDGDARLRVKAKMEAQGFPFPALGSEAVLRLASKREWPPSRQGVKGPS